MVATRKHLHELVDELPADQIATAARYLEQLRDTEDPVLRALLNAPIDDEPLTSEDEAAIAEGLEDIAKGRLVTHQELRRRLGLDDLDEG